MIVDVQTSSGRVIPTCSVHLMGPCPCRMCNGEGRLPRLGRCLRCRGDGCDPETRDDCDEPTTHPQPGTPK